MARALDLPGLDIDLTQRQAEIFVAAAVVEYIDRVFDPNDNQHSTVKTKLSRLSTYEIIKYSEIDRLHRVTTFTWASAEVTSASTSSASSVGNVASIS